MSPITHFLVGWAVGCSVPISRRERAMVAIAGVAADLDGLGAIAEVATQNSETPLLWFSEYHHVLGHNLGAALVVMGLALLISRRKLLAVLLTGVSFHLHLLGDILGGRGPDGYDWPIPYLLPFSDSWQLAWSGQWALNAWPNFAITGVLLTFAFYFAWKHAISPLEIISDSANTVFVNTLRNRFGNPERDLFAS
ncbi:MAG: metal-dependent hydrolase [bacterium]|nr:metal-dependent hydrolase [bacterium]